MPGGPGADLVLVQGGEFLAGLERFLDLPAGAGDLDQVGEPDPGWGVGAVERQLLGAAVAAEQEPVAAGAVGVGGAIVGVDERPVIEPLPLGPGSGREQLQARAGSRAANSSARRAPMPVMMGWALATART